jgi:hypothetical protein
MALSGPANAQELTISDYVRDLVAERPAPGEELVGGIMTGEIGEEESIDYTFRIDPTKTYVVYGACVDDCMDFDLLVQDGEGKVVDEDIEDDDVSFVRIAPGSAGDRLTVNVSTASCDADVCVTGIGLYEVTGRKLSLDDFISASIASSRTDVLLVKTIRERVASASPQGEVRIGDIMVNKMWDDDQVVYTFDIDPGKRYKVYGVCDYCEVFNLTAVNSSSRNTVGADDGDSSTEPTLVIRPGSAGSQLEVVLQMKRCDLAPCYAGVGVYEVATRPQRPDAINNFELAYEEFLQRLSVDRGPDDRPVSDLVLDTMQAGDSRSYDFTIDPRKRYWVWAAGYEECRIDLWAFDASGDIYAKNDQGDASSRKIIFPAGEWGSALTILVRMDDKADPGDLCITGLALFESDDEF